MKLTLDIPDDDAPAVLASIANGLLRSAEFARGDRGHDPEDRAALLAYADRLEALAEYVDGEANRIDCDEQANVARNGAKP